VGSPVSLYLDSNAKSKAEVDRGGFTFERRRRYEIAGSVLLNKDQATIDITAENRPILSWTGPVSELDSRIADPGQGRPGFGQGFGRFGPTRAAQPVAPSNQPLLHIIELSQENFAISSLQLKITKGWGEPVISVK
jgi:hypothetical protein